jgi:hypothetical protein
MKEGTSNLVVLYFRWWYGYLPCRLFLAFKSIAITLSDLFSVKNSILTLFSPWKRDTLSTDGLSLQEKFQIWILNLASRVIGFLVKIFVLVAFFVVFSISIALCLVAFITWMVFPLIILALIILGLMNFFGDN